MGKALLSTPANQLSNREKSNGFCSRVSTNKVALGVRNRVPPCSASTGIAGCGTGAADVFQSSGDLIRVGIRLFNSPSLLLLVHAATRSQAYS